MFKVITLTALIFIVPVALLRFVPGKNRVHDRYIQRDYEKLKRLDAQLQQEKTAVELPARHNTRATCHDRLP